MPDEVKEEVSLRNRNYLVGDLDEKTETLAGSEIQPLRDVLAEVFRSGRRIHFEGFVSVVGEVDLVEDLGSFVLDGFHLDLMRWILPLTVSQCLLQPL